MAHPMNRAGLLLCLALLQGAVAWAEENPFRLPDPEPGTGSRIRRDVAFWNLPLDKPYAALSEDEKARVRGMYEALPAECEPPFPADGLKHLIEGMSKAQKALTERGDLFAIAMVDASGDVQNVSYYETPSDEMAKAIGYLLVKEKFKPAMCDGRTVPMEFAVRSHFTVHW